MDDIGEKVQFFVIGFLLAAFVHLTQMTALLAGCTDAHQQHREGDDPKKDKQHGGGLSCASVEKSVPRGRG